MWGSKPKDTAAANPTGLSETTALQAMHDKYNGAMQQAVDYQQWHRNLQNMLMRQYNMASSTGLSTSPHPAKYPEFTFRVKACEGGFLVEVGDERHVVTDLTALGEIAVRYAATKALEK